MGLVTRAFGRFGNSLNLDMGPKHMTVACFGGLGKMIFSCAGPYLAVTRCRFCVSAAVAVSGGSCSAFRFL